MVVRVRLDGLNIVHARGKWYVYHRDTKRPLLKGFAGTRSDLIRHIEGSEEFQAAYRAAKPRDLKRTYPPDTLGGLIQWFENACPKWDALSDATRKDYRAAFLYVAPAWPAPLDTITQPELYDLRDKCAKEKWPRFADKMISALSSMFTQAVKRKKMQINLALGIDKIAKPNPNANREWSPDEWKTVREAAPTHLLTPMMIARYAGYRGQTIATLQWRSYQDDPAYGKCLRVAARKNNEMTWIPTVSELRSYLDKLDRTSLNVATRADGTPWETEVQMQTAVSHFLKDMERDGKVGAGLTLHGLRVTYAAGLRRDGADTSDVAAALGDRSERMGEHYTRHVENEARVIRAFKKARPEGSA